MSKKYILGIDPGSSKTGVALVDESGNIFKVEVILKENFKNDILDFLVSAVPEVCVIGDGTTSSTMQETLKKLFPSLNMFVINEAHSTEEARGLYWKLNPPKGLRKLFPIGMQTPPINLDGYAAAVLARRFLASEGCK